jgi:hypothetical protein
MGAAGTCWAATKVSVEELRSAIAQEQAVVSACAGDVAACDAKKVGDDVEVGDPGKQGGYAVRWGWLRDALTKAHDAKKPEDRAAAMKDAAAHLDEMAAETGSAPADVAKARGAVNAILATEEFGEAKGPSWWDIQKQKFWNFVEKLIDGVGHLGETVPWLLTALEWTFYLGAPALMLFLVLRAFSKQRLQVSLADGAALASGWDRESEDWAKLAEASAAAGDWREAVHGLYWAAIVYLEARRAWRHNPARTPREYVRLLKPGSVQQKALRGLTQVFERVWYGFEDVSGEEYAAARQMFAELAVKKYAGEAGGAAAAESA